MTYYNKINSFLFSACSLLSCLSVNASEPQWFLLHEENFIPVNPLGETEAKRFSTNLPRDEWIRFTTIQKDKEESKKIIDLKSNNILILNTDTEKSIDVDVQDSNLGSALYITGKGVTTLKGTNSHRGWTYIDHGTLAIQSDENLGAALHPISISEGTLTLTKDPKNLSLNRPIKIEDHSSATFDVPTGSILYLNGEIAGGSSKGLIKTGDGELIFNAPNTFSGKTTIEKGILHVRAKNLPGDVVNNSALTFHSSEDDEFSKKIEGAGTTNFTGPGKLKLTGNCESFVGNINVKDGGHLSLNTSVGGDVTVSNQGILSGNGKIFGNLFVRALGIVAPGNSIGTTIVASDFHLDPSSVFLVYVNGLGNSSLIDISGQAFLSGNVAVSPIDQTIRLDKTYTILEADGGINGSFDSVSVVTNSDQPLLYNPLLSYDANHTYLNFESTIFNGTKTFNQRQIARQLDGIIDPTESQFTILNKIVNLSNPQARHALNQMSGQQHAADLLVVEVINRQFIRRLYDPLRDIIGADPCVREWYEKDKCGCYGINTWIEGSGNYLSQKGGSNTTGFKFDGGEVTFGAMKTFENCLTTGIAGSYEYDYIRYHLGGKGSLNTFLGSIYALYRPAKFYVLTNLNFSYSKNSMIRPIYMGTLKYQAKSTPRIAQVTSYGEFGVDYRWEDLLIQPFFGLEAFHYTRNRVKEHGAEDLNLTIKNRRNTSLNSRLGVHLNAQNLPTDFNAYLDLSWNYRWTSNSNYIDEHFETFGTEFAIEGINLYKNSFEVAFAVTKEICYHWNFFAEYSLQFWKRSYSSSILGGFEYAW